MHSLPHQNGALGTTDGPALTHHYQPRPYFKSRLTPVFIHFVNLDKCIMTDIYHCGIVQSSFTAPKILCSTIHPSHSPTPGNYNCVCVCVCVCVCGPTGKESAWNAGDLGSIPELERSPGEGNGYPLQYSGLGNSMDCIVHGVTKSQTWLRDFHYLPSFTFSRVLYSWNHTASCGLFRLASFT